MKHTITLSALVAVAAMSGLTANAQTYPTKPITLIAPFPPGGSTDVIARLFATRLSARLGQNVVVDNKPGANGGIGAAAVARAKPDGYTILLMGASSFTINPLLYKSLNYDPVASYDYLGIAGGTQLVILTTAATGIGSIADIVSKSAAQPLSFGSFGTGSLPQIAGEYLAQKSGARLLHVPYKGSAPAMTDLIGNQITLSIDTLVAAMPQIRGGKVKAIAVSSRQRASSLPNVPTVQEAGITDYDFETWFGIVSPKGTPPEIAERLTREIREMMNEKTTREALEATGFDARYSDPRQFREQVAMELKRNALVIEKANIQVD